MSTVRRLEGRIALVTGASRGIGAAAAKRLAAEGAQVVLVARTQAGLEEIDDAIRAAGGAATLLPLDLTDFAKLDQMGAALFERFKRLDILVGAAGTLGELTPVHQLSPKVWERTLAINLTANWRLIRALDPLLRRSEAGRAVFLTSGITKAPRPYWSAHGVSKAGLEYLVRTYAEEIGAITNVRANLLDPGPTRTRMRAEAYPGEDPNRLKTPETAAEAVLELVLPSCQRNGEIVRLD